MDEERRSVEGAYWWWDAGTGKSVRNKSHSKGGGRRRISSLFNSLRQRLRPRWPQSASPARHQLRQEPRPQPSAPPMHLMLQETTPTQILDAAYNGVTAGGDVHVVGQTHAPVQHAFQAPETRQSITVGQPLPVQQQQQADPGSLSWLSDVYSVDWTPREYLVKFRQQSSGYRVGANFGFEALERTDSGDAPPSSSSILGYHARGFSTKLVFKPVGRDSKWKIMFEPHHSDVRLLTKKIPLGRWVNLQVGLGHNFHEGATGWKWKLSTSLGGSCVSQIQHKNMFPVLPGLDFRVGWNAEYSLPDIHGGLGTGEPMLGMNIGHLHASVERLEAIFTRCS